MVFECYECGKYLEPERAILVPMALQKMVVSKDGSYFQDIAGQWSRATVYCKHCLLRALEVSPNDFPVPEIDYCVSCGGTVMDGDYDFCKRCEREFTNG